MKELITAIFGTYDPVLTQEIVTVEIDGVPTTDILEVVAPGLAGVDWPWIAGVFLFGIVLWSFFRLLGVFFKV